MHGMPFATLVVLCLALAGCAQASYQAPPYQAQASRAQALRADTRASQTDNYFSFAWTYIGRQKEMWAND